MANKIRKAIITDAGFASRYLPITKTVPKGMMPFGNKPIMQFVVEECVEAGIEEIIIVATPEGKPIYEDYFNNSVNRIRKQLQAQGKEDRYEPVQHVLDFPKIVVIEQDTSLPYGNGSPIASARKFVETEEAFLVLYSDDVVFGNPGDAKVMVETYMEDPDIAGVIMAQGSKNFQSLLMITPKVYLEQTYDELKKVHWPSRQDIVRLTIIVLVISLVVGLYIGGLDFLFVKITETILK